MKTLRFAIALTVVNLVILTFTLFRSHRALAQDAAQILRGRGLEIVDAEGRTRAAILVLPPSTMPDGQKYPETALLRLIDPNGRPGVKIGTSAEGSGMSLAGDSERREWNGVQILANAPGESGSLVKLTNKDGRVQLLKP